MGKNLEEVPLGETKAPTMSQGGVIAICAAAVFCIDLSGSVVNASVYSAMASYFGIGRELATLITAGLFFVVAVLAMKRPTLFDCKQISIAVVCMLALAIFLLGMALELQNPTFVMVGLLCRSIGRVWAMTVFSVALTTITSTRGVLLAVGAGMVLSGLVGGLIPTNLPFIAISALLMLSSLIPIALTWRLAMPQFRVIQQSTAASSLGLSEFGGFKALRSLFLCMFMISIAAGYSLTFNEESNAPLVTYAETLAVAVVVVALYARSAHEKGLQGSEDQLFSLAALLIVAGYLSAPYTFGSDASTANGLLRAGRDCFNMLMWLVLASVGRRNIFVLLPVLGAVRCISSIGTDIGAVTGRVTNGFIEQAPAVAGTITTVFLFAFIVFLWLGFREFSFSRIIEGMKRVTEPEMAQLGDHIETQCRDVGKRNGLTERETEILCLLAKGRDGRFIANEYVLSYNTVKTHIKHIYHKLDVHSRQELIDLVGSTPRD